MINFTKSFMLINFKHYDIWYAKGSSSISFFLHQVMCFIICLKPVPQAHAGLHSFFCQHRPLRSIRSPSDATVDAWTVSKSRAMANITKNLLSCVFHQAKRSKSSSSSDTSIGPIYMYIVNSLTAWEDPRKKRSHFL